MYYNDFYDTGIVSNASNSVDETWLIISAVLAVVGGIVAYILFVSKKNKGEYTGFVKWLHDFLNFKNFFIEVVLKALYMICVIYITLSSFSYISISVATFFMYLILGNIVARIAFEIILMFLTLVRNTTEINEKIGSYKKETEKTSSKIKKKTMEEDEEEKMPE